MERYQHIEKFQIKYCDVDFKDELKISSALAYMEEAACLSADELGFGYKYVKERGLAFILSNISCEFLRPVCLGEIVQIHTWPLPPSYVVFGREYQFLSQTGELLIKASSRWCLVEIKSGKIMQSKTIEGQDYSTYNTNKAIENVTWKIPSFKTDEGEFRFSLTVAYSEYDHNMHVNNTRYADYCMNCFTIDELTKKKVKRFSIAYIKACKEGDTLRFYRKEDADGSFLAVGINEKNETVVQAQIVFGN